MRLQCAGLTDTGMVRDHNEDSFLVSQTESFVVVADGMGGGVQTVATFVPPIFFLFLFLAILEDSGYMARAAFVMDRLMRAIGLPGRAFVPLIVGFGCNVPAIMAAKDIPDPKERALTMLMVPFMSCSARLPVYSASV